MRVLCAKLNPKMEGADSPTVAAVEVVWMIGVVLKDQRLLLNDGMTLLADVLAQSASFLTVMTGTTKVPAAEEMGVSLERR